MSLRLRSAVLAGALAAAACLPVGAQKKTPPAVAAKTPAPPGDSQDASQIYRNAAYGFRYQVPYGWVDRTKQMQEGAEAGKSEVLLAVFERPPDAPGNTINSAVVIASEAVSAYPGLKSAEDYTGPLTESAVARGFKASGDPYTLEVESRRLLRADFVKMVNDKLTMHQSTLVLVAKGQIVSFTFLAGSEEELDELMDGLHFGVAKAGR